MVSAGDVAMVMDEVRNHNSVADANPRETLLQAFLAQQPNAPFERTPIAGDASFRRYERLVDKEGRRWILMDAPPPQEDVQPFIVIARYLKDRGLSAPSIIAADISHGFLLLEDLGQGLIRVLLDHLPAKELAYYRQAVDVLLSLRDAQNLADVAAYDAEAYLRELRILLDWFAPHVGVNLSDADKQAFLNLWQEPLAHVMQHSPQTLVLRDYHAENLLWLPEREGNARLGLLDFQDALWGSAAYDLVSLLEDARRDVCPEVAADMLNYYIAERFGKDEKAGRAFRDAYAILGAQRNLKIVGVFARLCERDGKRRYLQYLPRVWGYVWRDLQHPMLTPVAAWLRQHFPADVMGKA